MMTYKQKCFRLFFLTIYMSLVAFGGGVIILGLLRRYFVEKYGWMTDDEMNESIAIAQTAPGAIAGNAVMVVGYNVAGVFGATLTMIASIIPPLIVISLMSVFYHLINDNSIAYYVLKAMRAGVGAVILSIVIDMIRKVAKGKSAIVILILAFIACYFLKIHAIIIILIAAVSGIAHTYIRLLMKKKADLKNDLS